MADYGDKVASRAISKADKELQNTYKQAQKELKKKLADFNRRFAEKDKEKRKQLKDGEITEQQYKDWLAGQVFVRQQWENKVKQINAVLLDHNQQAIKLINESRLDVFAENYNFLAFKTEGQIAVSFNVYNAEAVAKLMLDDPDLLPEWKVDEEKDYQWNRQKVNNIIRQGIIQGESIDQITDRLCTELSSQNENKMRMFARTAVTEAENAGRQKQMQDLEDMGVEVEKQWIATHDNRTRDAHRGLDGEKVPQNQPFSSSLGPIMFPGDPSASPANVYNCRCTMRTFFPKYQNENDKEWSREEEIDGQSYEEWKKGKQKKDGDNDQTETIMGSTSGIIRKTTRFNEQEHKNDERIRKLDEEYSRLYTESLTKYGTKEYEEITRRMEQIEKEIAHLREESVKIQADRSRYLAENGEKEIMRLFGRIKGKHNAALDAKSVNVITADHRTQRNCASCALAYDARRRGIDSQARLSFGTNNSEIETWWEGMKFKTTGKYRGSDAREEIRMIATQWGEGARGVVQVDWSSTTGHTFVFEVVQGRCIFIDPQTGVINADDLFIGAVPGSVKYARTDDKELTRAAVFGMRGKNE